MDSGPRDSVTWSSEVQSGHYPSTRLIIFKGEEPRGSLTFYENEQEELKRCQEAIKALNPEPRSSRS